MNTGKIFLCLLLCTVLLDAQQSRRQEAFGIGERLSFNVNFGFITAGYAEMNIPSLDTVLNTATYKVEFTVRSTPTFDLFFKVRDRYETYLDTATIVPWRFEQHIREGSFARDYVATFDHRNGIARTDEGDFPIPPDVHDIMSAFYYARTLDFSGFRMGQKVGLKNFFKGKTNPLEIKYLGKQRIDVAAGTFNCIIIEPLVKEGGLFKSEGRILIWLSDDDNKIPVKVSTKIVIGTIDAELREFTGVRNNVKAKVQ